MLCKKVNGEFKSMSTFSPWLLTISRLIKTCNIAKRTSLGLSTAEVLILRQFGTQEKWSQINGLIW